MYVKSLLCIKNKKFVHKAYAAIMMETWWVDTFRNGMGISHGYFNVIKIYGRIFLIILTISVTWALGPGPHAGQKVSW